MYVSTTSGTFWNDKLSSKMYVHWYGGGDSPAGAQYSQYYIMAEVVEVYTCLADDGNRLLMGL